MKVGGVVGLIIIFMLVIASIVVGNWFFANVIGIDVDKLPSFLKFVVHMSGAIAVGYVALKVFKR